MLQRTIEEMATDGTKRATELADMFKFGGHMVSGQLREISSLATKIRKLRDAELIIDAWKKRLEFE